MNGLDGRPRLESTPMTDSITPLIDHASDGKPAANGRACLREAGVFARRAPLKNSPVRNIIVIVVAMEGGT